MKVFKAKNFIKHMGEGYDPESDNYWMSQCEGKPLTIKHENGDGMIDDYFIAKEWLADN